MKTACREFRERLESALTGRPMPSELDRLEWHDHLGDCRACRGLLQAEQVLEELLATLPAPKLPPLLAQRVALRLRQSREQDIGLDALLELDAPVSVPAGLSGKILTAVGDARALDPSDANLDALLDLQPKPALPPQLTQRTLHALEVHRRQPVLRALAARKPRVIRWAAAAVVAGVLALLVWRRIPVSTMDDTASSGSSDDAPATVADAAAEAAVADALVVRSEILGSEDVLPDVLAPHGEALHGETAQVATSKQDDELLAALDLLESWEVLMSEDLDLFLSSVDPSEGELAEWEAETWSGFHDEESGDSSGAGDPTRGGTVVKDSPWRQTRR